MNDQFSRETLILGDDALLRLQNAHVAVFGIGGVGSFCAEALARAGVGSLTLVDDDVVALSNLNRQLIALHSTIGRSKVQVAAERAKDINPDIVVNCHECFFLPETADQFDFSKYDYVIDAIDTVSGKIEIILRSQAAGVPVISAMGAGNKLDPSRFEVADIYETKVCPLARAMRGLLKKRGVKKLKVVYSQEEAIRPNETVTDENGRVLPGSSAFVPPVAGLILAGEVIRDLAAGGKEWRGN